MRAHPAGPRHGDVISQPGVPKTPSSGELNALAANIWPQSARRNSRGEIQIGDVPVTQIAKEYATPIFVMDETDLKSRAKEFLDSFSKLKDQSLAKPTTVYYAAKAFLSTYVAKTLHEIGLSIDVCTEGELLCALKAGVDPKSILLHGNNKSDREIQLGVEHGVGVFVIDSLREILALEKFAKGRNKVSVLIRLTTGVEAHTHEFIATAHEDQKFGFSIQSGQAEEAVSRVMKAKNINLLGFHSHIGSQIFDSSGFEVAASRIVEFARQMEQKFSFKVSLLNLGGGIGIAYTPDDSPISVSKMSDELISIVKDKFGSDEIPQLAIEPGRAIIGPSTITLYTVGTIKPVTVDGGLIRNYVSVDGGMSDNIRTALYDANYSVTLASRTSDAEPMLCRIVGKHCETGDIVVRDAWLPSDLREGDLLAVAATGAYCRSMASQYNLVTRPGVIAVADGKTKIVIRPETYEDLFATDPGF
ncbi:MAG: diaminopimelate decarboxylase [Candidatus Nanopelagicales bacterium]